ncbi:putative F-box/LRR-repeat protein At5g02930 [Mercurialis annua]|uniref:putative F-box/LRR-repeat protein At5g02930 n=1 Tax=Mercurialis annua TaxID=3986 RepID=UPI00215EE3E0|nr:putative F-box/LRR-repeat protein At5g02930 [Mercurialis annua]
MATASFENRYREEETLEICKWQSKMVEGHKHRIIKRVVNETLALHSSSKLDKFSIQIDLRKLYHPSIELLTLAFTINGRSSTGYLLPQFLYSNSHIRILTTTLCEFVPHGRISWSALKMLSIQEATLNDEVIQNILNGTPVLEDLQLYFCCGIKLLDLSLKPKLKNLVINVCAFYFRGSDDNFELKIVGPFVETLKISGSWVNFKCKLMSMSSLVKATLNFKVMDDGDHSQERCQNMVKELIENVLPAEQLQLTNFCTQALSTLRMDVKASIIKFEIFRCRLSR